MNMIYFYQGIPDILIRVLQVYIHQDEHNPEYTYLYGKFII